MILPLGTDRPRTRPTRVTTGLIAVNVAVFAVLTAFQFGRADMPGDFIARLALSRDRPAPLAFLGYAFVHAGPWHLAGNMLFLWVFGPPVEDRFGRLGFLAFYLIGAAAAGAVHILVSPAPVVGASGAVSGVTGAFLVLFPLTAVRVLLFFILIGVYSIPAWWFIAFAIARDLLPIGAGWSDGVAHGAHLAGYAYGAGVAVMLLGTRVLDREMYDLFTLGRQASRRRAIREAARSVPGPGGAARRRPAPVGSAEPETSPVAELRARIGAHVAARRWDAAFDAYRELIAGADAGAAAALSRRVHLDLANQLFRASEAPLARRAYEDFLAAYPRDPESPGVRLLLALLLSGGGEDGARARTLAAEALPALRDEEQKDLARRIIAGAAPGAGA